LRAGWTLWCLLSSAFALLCHDPVSRAWVEARFYPDWAALFVGFHLPLFAALTCASLAALRPRGRAAAAAGAFYAAAAVLLFARPMPLLQSGAGALAAAFLFWLPLFVWESAVHEAEPEPLEADAERMLSAALASAACAWALFSLPAAWRQGGGPLALAWSLVLHLLLFLLLYALWACARGRFAAAGVWAALFLVFWKLVFPALAFFGAASAALAAWAAAALTAAWAGAARRPARPWLQLSAAVLLALCAPWLARRDWGGLFQTLAALASWALLAAAFNARPPFRLSLRPALAAALAFGVFFPVGATALAWLKPSVGAKMERVLRAHAEADPSFRAARRVFGLWAGDGDLFAFLRARTNLPAGAVRPPEPRVLRRTAGRKPHIFLIAVDSLRQDYVGAYNTAARSTPAMDAFAAEGLLFRRAFTAYAGTGLSEPSIWAGSLLPHRQPIVPFAPFNSLEALLESEGYRRWVSMGPQLRDALRPLPGDEPLDKDAIADFSLCRSLGEVERRLPRLKTGPPAFVYTRAEDLHFSVMEREEEEALRRPGVDPAYAGRLAELDACFGRFIGKLKKEGLYEDSVLILTSDHGDLLGEGRRWGHASTVRPEVLKVPLILRVPERLRAGLSAQEGPAFLIDIAPTLYALLGREPPRRGRLAGRPLLARAVEPNPRPPQLVASSFNPVYGVVSGDGRFLYEADAVDLEIRWYDLEERSSKARRPPAGAGAEAKAALRSILLELDRTFGGPG